MKQKSTIALPDRSLGLPSFFSCLGFALFFAFFVWALVQTELSFSALVQGFPQMGMVLDDMLPPSPDRAWPMASAALLTFQMAVAGTVIGVMISLPLAVLASSKHSPNRLIFVCARSLISFVRTVPELVWALFFIASVGIGSPAGTMAIVCEVVGFCGRFFAEALEEVDAGPSEALAALGATPLGILMCSVFPTALPAIISSALYALEKAVRSSTVLGLVGAGGIGVELMVSMEMFRYDQASMIILLIFIMVWVVEYASNGMRNKILEQSV